MKKKVNYLILGLLIFWMGALLISLIPEQGFSAAITSDNSTQPRKSPTTSIFNEQGLHLGPIVEGFRGPQYRGRFYPDYFHELSGTPMMNIMRDPYQYAMLNISNQDFIDLANSLEGEPTDEASPLGQFLKKIKVFGSISRASDGRLQPERLLAVSGDICNRCHSPMGWLEGRSEPKTPAFPFLQGQFWQGAFREYPGHKTPFLFRIADYWSGFPRFPILSQESEAEMDAIQCDYCHRQYAGQKRTSYYDGSSMSSGNGTFFVNRYNVLRIGDSETPDQYLANKDEHAPPLDHGGFEPYHEFLHSAELCGTCHDVTNPFLKTRNQIKHQDGSAYTPDMLHPIERTYTEWYHSAYRSEGTVCQDCHTPMKFPGAQSWLLKKMESIWGSVDETWTKHPYNYSIPPIRTAAYDDRIAENKVFIKKAATVRIPGLARMDNQLRVRVKVINNTGHKLPTGYPEGRIMWIHLEAKDEHGNIFFEDGSWDSEGKLVRTEKTKVYECVPVDAQDKKFHFVLNNLILKDNRIPPRGFVREAYEKDGAFIIPYDSQDTDYPSGQNWDITTYNFPIPGEIKSAGGKITVTATLYYLNFDYEFTDFLAQSDPALTLRHGGPARNIPPGPYETYQKWGQVVWDVWSNTGSKSLRVGRATKTITLEPF